MSRTSSVAACASLLSGMRTPAIDVLFMRDNVIVSLWNPYAMVPTIYARLISQCQTSGSGLDIHPASIEGRG